MAAKGLVTAGVFPDEYSATAYLVSLVGLACVYYSVVYLCGYSDHPILINCSEWSGSTTEMVDQARTRQSKLRSWVLTGTSALIMTLGSTPFLWDLVQSYGDVAMVRRREGLSGALVPFFAAYLQLDCVLGWCHYRKQITLLTGWVHHTAYQVLLFYVMKSRLSHVFAMAAVMELPTAVLALSMLVPATRSDIFFSVIFFSTRILFHAYLFFLYVTSYGRMFGTQNFNAAGTPIPSWLPVIGLTCAGPLHVFWFSSSVRGTLRRRSRAQALKSVMVVESLPMPLEGTVTDSTTSSSEKSLGAALHPSSELIGASSIETRTATTKEKAAPTSTLTTATITTTTPTSTSPSLSKNRILISIPRRPKIVSMASSYLASSRPTVISISFPHPIQSLLNSSGNEVTGNNVVHTYESGTRTMNTRRGFSSLSPSTVRQTLEKEVAEYFKLPGLAWRRVLAERANRLAEEKGEEREGEGEREREGERGDEGRDGVQMLFRSDYSTSRLNSLLFEYDEYDMLKALPNPSWRTPSINTLKMRAGKSYKDTKKFGGQIRRTVGGMVAAGF